MKTREVSAIKSTSSVVLSKNFEMPDNMESVISSPVLDNSNPEVHFQPSGNPLNFPLVESRKVTFGAIKKEKVQEPLKFMKTPTTSELPPVITQTKNYKPDSILQKHEKIYFDHVKKQEYDFSNIFEYVNLKAKL